MLYIRTGLMGHGKTLNTIKEVDAKAFQEGRPVYYANLTGLQPEKLKADWFEFEDVHRWFDLPTDSIIVVDEAQQFFGTRDPRGGVPEHCSRFEIMRKQGHEMHLITQDPRFLDVHARRLCGKHIHYARIFGSSKIMRYETERCYETVDKFPTYKLADKQAISLDKKLFGVYSSAQAGHHFKFKPSRKAIMFVVLAILAILALLRAYNTIFSNDTEIEESEGVISQVQTAINASPAGALLNSTPSADRPSSAAEYFNQRQPRLHNVPSSAPIYDDLTQPKSHPRLFCTYSDDPDFIERTRHSVGVYEGRQTACVCYTQQVTKADVGFLFCMSAARDGYFDPTRPERSGEGFEGNSQQSMVSRPPPAPAHQQLIQQPDQYSQANMGTRVTVVPYQKGEFLW